jgi:hypothetical protein
LRQSGLPYPTDAGQGHQTGVGQETFELSDLLTTADKAAQLRRQIPDLSGTPDRPDLR